ncbi:MAG TPA: glycosyltransferase [Planctomycetota bacterium]|nr:glycosyltransferase [Planctomycetota bacterium]
MPPLDHTKHLLTVSVEDYFHSGSLQGVVAPKHWTRIESRLEKSIRETLDLLGEHRITATFFVLGWIAERQPEIVRMIRAAGHEIASRGFGKGEVRSPQALRENLQRTREALERAGSNRIFGYRHWRWLNRPEELWVLDVLAAEGYAYDSSVSPLFRRFRRLPSFFQAHPRPNPGAPTPLWEFPVSTTNFMGYRIPISGGNYLRQLPHRIMSQAIAEWHRSRKTPILFYFFPWEIDCEQPQIQGLSTFQRIRHYRRIGKTRHVMRKYARLYQFQPIGDFLGIPWRSAPVIVAPPRPVAEILTAAPELPPDALSVTVVVPLYNEETNIPYLRGNLIDLAVRLSRQFRVQFLLVDDGSSDGTWKQLQERFADLPGCRLVQHEKNAGVAAAIMTGIRQATTPIVATMDCDCSYDPTELEKMIPMIRDAELVTASPYHPDGEVYNVPPWRLFLSRTLSSIYSLLLSSKIHTYTSCFRVYRKEAVENITIRQGGFLGVAEMLIRLRLAGGRVVEYPTTLASRLFGESKMKIIRTIFRHLGLIGELVRLRFRGEAPPAVVGPAPSSAAVVPAPVSSPAPSQTPTTTPVETP